MPWSLAGPLCWAELPPWWHEVLRGCSVSCVRLHMAHELQVGCAWNSSSLLLPQPHLKKNYYNEKKKWGESAMFLQYIFILPKAFFFFFFLSYFASMINRNFWQWFNKNKVWVLQNCLTMWLQYSLAMIRKRVEMIVLTHYYSYLLLQLTAFYRIFLHLQPPQIINKLILHYQKEILQSLKNFNRALFSWKTPCKLFLRLRSTSCITT